MWKGCLADNDLANVREKRHIIAFFWQQLLSPIINKDKALCELKATGNSLVRLGNGRAYFFSTAKATWDAAKTTCLGMGGHLLTVDSLKENGLIVLKINSIIKATIPAVTEAQSYWIGLNDKQAEGIFKYTYLGQSPSISFWNVAEPIVAAKDTKDCVAYTAAVAVPAGAEEGAPPVPTGIVDWTTNVCSDANKFICEFEAPCSFLLTATPS